MDEKYFISRITTDVVDNETGKTEKIWHKDLIRKIIDSKNKLKRVDKRSV